MVLGTTGLVLLACLGLKESGFVFPQACIFGNLPVFLLDESNFRDICFFIIRLKNNAKAQNYSWLFCPQ
jgi:hypothetical protein